MPNPRNPGRMGGFSFLLTILFSLAALVATFLISTSDLAFETKTSVFLPVAAGYLLICAALYFQQKRALPENEPGAEKSHFGEAIENKLLALEEANEFFGASLKTNDMFRLVASRINEIAAFDACVMYLLCDDESFLKIKFAAGENAKYFSDFKADVHRTLAARVLLSGKAQIDGKLFYDRMVFPPDVLGDLSSSVAVPLYHGEEVFAVLTLYARKRNFYDEQAMALLEAVAERVAPLFAGSFAFERNISNALTDPLTNLPNERALFLMLENQIAESHRFRDERPLTVLAIDIRNFAELNQKYGHSTGDRILIYAAETIKKQLRQMDVLSRAAGDEFLAILPTANEIIAQDVIGRVRRSFAANPFELYRSEKIHLEIKFGAATFWHDGETANELLQTAILKKRQNKSGEKRKVLWFPREYVN